MQHDASCSFIHWILPFAHKSCISEFFGVTDYEQKGVYYHTNQKDRADNAAGSSTEQSISEVPNNGQDQNVNIDGHKYHGHLSSVHSISLHPTLNLIASSGRDACIRLWDIRSR